MSDDDAVDEATERIRGLSERIIQETFLRDGRIAMTPWMPGLAEGGPAGMHFGARERAGVSMADLRLVRPRPASVR
jgi:hypothetical protein